MQLKRLLPAGRSVGCPRLVSHEFFYLAERIDRLDEKLANRFEFLDNKIENVERRLTEKIENLDNKFTNKIDNLRMWMIGLLVTVIMALLA